MAHAGSSDDIEVPIRRERAAIAAQACQTCRTRKSKCDEQRPKCGLCQRLGLDCQYREPLPTKKDKSLANILEAIVRLELKIDNLQPQAQQTMSTVPDEPLSSARLPRSIVPASRQLEQLSAAHRVFVWPSIYVHLVQSGIPAVSDLQYIIQRGSAWLVEQESKRSARLDMTPSLPATSMNRSPSRNVTFSWPTPQLIESYIEAYFHTFNALYPILDQESFLNVTLPPVASDGYGYGDASSVLALLVYALGQTALQGTLDQPISSSKSTRSGIRGGSTNHPPGLEIFNEARKRIGLMAGNFTIEVIQCHLLQAMYYSANAMHLESWRCNAAAAMAFQVHLRIHSYDWSYPASEIVKRIFWLVSVVPARRRAHHQSNFRAVLSLEKLVNDINVSILEPSVEQSRTNAFPGPPMPLVREMARQLDSWRSLLPRQLQWLDNERFDFPSTDSEARQPLDRLFAPDQGTVPIRHRYSLDIATAYLRTRFYYARYLMYQPFVYKVLHFPELLVKDDAECAAAAIRSACMWPIIMAPPKDKKRLIPFLSTWTQTFVSVLLIFEMTRVNSTLRAICEDHIDPNEVQTTVALMLDWLEDVKEFDGIAAWSWGVLQPLFRDQRDSAA
ncbi:hypothetical protein AMS68_005859 [Peltaster fructicola]|uniref:Zn(2)-C6 fungal-type domain-containing protein n=1 Tax=Peltaster fructicola TaxID=286661 RepID=A0A6H0XZY7_9PEZI|nr:hypothetical protein AMS68_005859 [Peltaster fructicola]